MADEPVDKSACRAACDLVEEHGFDPSVVAFLRKACRPTVDEVLPLAIEYHREHPSGLWDFFHHGILTDLYSSLEPACDSLLGILQEMSPNQRRKVARRARQAIEAENTIRTNAVAWNTPENATPVADLRAAMERMRGFGIGPPPFRFPEPMPRRLRWRYTQNFHGNTTASVYADYEVIRTGEDGRGPWIEARSESGTTHRFSGNVLPNLEFLPD